MAMKEELRNVVLNYGVNPYAFDDTILHLLKIICRECDYAWQVGYDMGYTHGEVTGHQAGLDKALRNAEGFADHYLHLTLAEKQRMKKVIHTGVPC